MSFEAMKWAIRVGAPSPAAGHVLIILADYAKTHDGAYRCWPSHQSIADRTGMSVRAVGTHVRALEKAGRIDVVKRRGGSSVYVLHVPEADENCRPGSADIAEVADEAPRQDLPEGRQDLPRGSAGFADKPIKNQSITHLSARKRATQFPNDFTFEDVREWTRKWSRDNDYLVGADEFEQFKDHALANGKTHVDWTRAWYNWARNEKKYDRKPRAAASGDNFGGAAYGVFS